MMKYAFARTVATVVLTLLTVLLMAAAASICLASCTRRPATTEAAAPVHQGVPAAQLPRADSAAGMSPTPMSVTPPAQPNPTLFRRLFPSKRQRADQQAQALAWPASSHAQPVPKKCKGCQFTTVVGNQNSVGQSNTEKKANSATGEGASQSTAGANAQLQTTNGDNNQQDAKKQDTTAEAPGPLAVIADNLTGPLGMVLGLCALAGIVVFLIRRKAANTLTS